MSEIDIQLPNGMFETLQAHLLPPAGDCEEAAFLFARVESGSEFVHLAVVDCMLIPPEGFASRSRFYLELTDASRAAVIKRAHDLGAGLIECHSHPGQRGACFSWSDLHGFDDFVPHARWRLGGRAYAAVVFANDSVDALAWSGSKSSAVPVLAICADERSIQPTGLTFENWSSIYERQPL